VIVLEIARQLEAQGREVGAFTVLDYAIAAGEAPAPAPLLMAFAKNLPRWIGDDALPTGVGGLASRVRSKVRRLTPWRDEDDRAERPRDIRDELGLWRFPDSQVAMLRLHLDVLRAYVPKPFGGRATLILPRTGPLLGPFPEANDYGWKAIARGGVDIHTVPGSHSTFERAAAAIAAHIEANIRRRTRLGDPWAQAGRLKSP
jgi:thioesterase domain-containing protein